MDAVDCFQGASIYLQLGFEHILDINGYDHILFVAALCVNYRLKAWRQVAILVTAFTLGHSLTLALAVFNLIRIPSHIIELLIPITILISAVSNLLRGDVEVSPMRQRLNYGLALGFGFIHGLGFSNYLRALLGGESCVGGPLLMFNIGLELGQLIVVALIMTLGWVAMTRLNIPQRYWNGVFSTLIALVALQLIWQQLLG